VGYKINQKEDVKMRTQNNRVREFIKTLNGSEREYAMHYANREDWGIYPGLSPIRQQQLRWEVEKREGKEE
jgi:hypothetical protein